MSNVQKTILFADENQSLASRIVSFFSKDDSYRILLCQDGEEVLSQLKNNRVDLCILDIFLPKIHGIELLKRIKKSSSIGVIVTSYEPMIQNYRAAISCGVDFFLEKPFTDKRLKTLIDKFFAKELKPEPFSSCIEKTKEGEHCFVPKSTEGSSYIKFWGTRGSSSVSGPEYMRFGGNTCCLEIRSGNTAVIIDAGSGIRDIGEEIRKDASIKNIHLFLGHTHLDHIGGFPSFSPLYHKEYAIFVHGPLGFYKSTKELFSEMLTHAFFPVGLEEVQAEVSFNPIHTLEPMVIGDITLTAHHTYHPGPTLGFKVKVGKMTFGYITDNEVLMGYHGDPALIKEKDPLLEPHLPLIEFLKGSDFIIHEAQYTPIMYQTKVGWGHSSISNASVFIKQTGVKLWIVTHHDPADTDTILQAKHQTHLDLLEHCGIDCHIRMAHDGLKIAF